MKRIPEFIVVGPPKTATTWLFKCLIDHPGVYLPDIKQCHYFDRNYDKGLDWYSNHFSLAAGTTQICGDITPDYISSVGAPGRIVETCGKDIKIVVVHRNPMERSQSEYLMKLRSGKVTGSFSDAVIQNEAIIQNSLYHKNITEFLKFIPRGNLHIISYENIVNEPAQVLEELCSFLEIPTFEPKFTNTYVNKGGGVSRYKKVFMAGIFVRKQVESSALGRKALSFFRDMGLFKLWHRVVLKRNDKKVDRNDGAEEIYQKYLREDDSAMSIMLGSGRTNDDGVSATGRE